MCAALSIVIVLVVEPSAPVSVTVVCFVITLPPSSVFVSTFVTVDEPSVFVTVVVTVSFVTP